MPFPFSPFMDPNVTAATGGDPYGLGQYGMTSPWANVGDAIAGAGFGLMQASMPSAQPKDFGTMFGGLAGGAAQALQGREDKMLKRAMVGSQVALAQQKVKQLTEWQKLLSGGADAAPTDAGAFPPSPAPNSDTPAAGTPDREKFVQTMMPHALAVSQATGLDPRLVLAQSALETGYGSAAPGNNFFGIKSHGAPGGQTLPTQEAGPGGGMVPAQESFRTYADPGASARDYADFIKTNSRYAPVLAAKGLDAQINAMGQSGYASDPNYGAKLRQIAQSLPPAQMPGPPQDLVSRWTTAQMPGAPAGLTPATAMAQMPGPPQGLTPPGPPMAPMPQVGGPAPGVPGPVAAGPAVAQGDASGNPVQQAQFTPQAPPVAAQPPIQATPQAQPKTIQEVVRSMPPGVRQLIGAMGPEAGIKEILKYADPDSVPAFDPRTGQMVFVPKTALGSGQYQPVDAATFSLAKQKEARESINSKVVQGPGGPQPNAPLLQYDKGVSAAQGTDPEGKMLVGDYDDARKHNTEMQSGALQARTGIAQTNRLSQLLDQVNTGRFTSTTQEIKQMAKGIGVNLEALGVKDDTAPAQAAQALTSQLALTLRNPSQGAGMPGALSDADRNFLTKMVPGLETTPEGRALMVDYSRKMYQRQIEMAKISNDFMRSGEAKRDPNALYQKLQDHAEKNPLFTEKDLPQTKPGSLPMPGKVRRFNPATGTLE